MLTEGPRDLPERLQTMRSAIAWSVDLLDEDERRFSTASRFFPAVSPSPRPWACWRASNRSPTRSTIESAVVSLVEKSLVRPLDISGDEPRFVMYETIREYAGERLGEQDDAVRLAGAHAEHFLTLAEASEAGLMSPDPLPTFQALEIEIANLRAALGPFAGAGEIETAMRIASALAWFWTEPRFLAEGQRWLGALLEESAAAPVPGDLRVRALIAAGDLAIWQGELDEAAAFQSEALELLRDGGDERQMAAVLRSLANVALERNQFSRADELLTESRDRARSAGNDWEVAASANLLGLSKTMQGSPDWAIERHREAVDIWRELGDSGHVFDALAGLGWAQLQAGTAGGRRALVSRCAATGGGIGRYFADRMVYPCRGGGGRVCAEPSWNGRPGSFPHRRRCARRAASRCEWE